MSTERIKKILGVEVSKENTNTDAFLKVGLWTELYVMVLLLQLPTPTNLNVIVDEKYGEMLNDMAWLGTE